MTNTPTLETERLILRQFQPEDADAVFAMYSDPETMKYIPMFPLTDKGQAAAHLQKEYLDYYKQPFGCRYAICLKGNDAPIGYVHLADDESHDFGYLVRREYWRKGIGSEAAGAVVDWLRPQLPYITATHDVNNPGSGSVMRKLGMRYCYSYKELWQPKNFWVTFRMYQLNFDGQDRIYRAYWERYPDHFIETL